MADHLCHHHQHYLVTSLNKSIQAVKLLPMLTHHSSNHISNRHHAYHSPFINHWNVPDPIFYPQNIYSKLRASSILGRKSNTRKQHSKISNNKNSRCTSHQLHCTQNSGARGDCDKLVLQPNCRSILNQACRIAIERKKQFLIYLNREYYDILQREGMRYTSSVMISPTLVDLDDLPCTMIFLR